MKLTEKEAAGLKREMGELVQKRKALKETAKNHRSATTEELSETADQLRAMTERIEEITENLLDAPDTAKRGLISLKSLKKITAALFNIVMPFTAVT